MLLRKPHFFIQTLSISTSSKIRRTEKSSLNWRIQIKETQLISQISSILLQRKNWVPLLRNLNLSSKLTPSLFLRILHRIQTQPQLSLNFFTWSKKSNLGFEIDLKSHCKITQILLTSGLSESAKPILDSLVRTYPPTQIVDWLIQSCKGTDSHSPVLSSVLECYCSKGLYLGALEVFQKSKINGFLLSIHSCNSLLETLQDQNEFKLAWCLCGSIFRNGYLPDQFTWSLMARTLFHNEKFQTIVRISDMGVSNYVIYSLIIEGCSKIGDFKAAFHYLNQMYRKKIEPGFTNYSSILDGACRYGDFEVEKMVMNSMVKKGYLEKSLLNEYDSVIQKLAKSGKAYAAEIFFRRACDEKIELKDDSFDCMFKAFSSEGRAKDAIRIYRLMLERKMAIDDCSYDSFVNVLCEDDPIEEEASEILRDLIKSGYVPSGKKLSKFLAFEGKNGNWEEAGALLNAVVEKGLLPNSFSCSSLVQNYCFTLRIDSAISLHNSIAKIGGRLDLNTYNVLLDGLFKGGRVEEAVRVFDYMRKNDSLSSLSFSIAINGLCRVKEMRKAMRLHDEMLKLGLKPDRKSYKRLISGFR